MNCDGWMDDDSHWVRFDLLFLVGFDVTQSRHVHFIHQHH